jgi:hypothetical protein
MMALDKSTMLEVIEKSVALLESRCIRLNRHEPDWRGLFLEHTEEVTRSASPTDFEARVNAVLGRGDLSHVTLFDETAQRAPARYAINATFCGYDTPDGSRWSCQDVREGGPPQVDAIRSGDVLLKANGDSVQPPLVPTVALGADHLLTVEGTDGTVRQVQVALRKAEARGKASAKPSMAEPIRVTARLIRPRIGLAPIALSQESTVSGSRVTWTER